MKNEIAFYQFFQFISCWVDLHAFIQICNSAINSNDLGVRQLPCLGLAIFVTGFVVIYQRMRNKDGNDPDGGCPKQNGPVNITIYNIYFNGQSFNQKIEINLNKLVLVILRMIVPDAELKCYKTVRSYLYLKQSIQNK